MIPQKIFSIISAGVICLTFISCSKNSDTTPVPNPGQTVLPEISVLNVSQPITANSTTLQFYINLNKSSTSVVSVDYSLADGTAVSPKDYVSASGTLTFPAGKVQAIVDVQVNGDPTNLRRANVQFSLQLSKPVQCTLATTSALATILTEDGTYLSTDNTGYPTPMTYPGYTLVWSDEFSGSTLDLNTWNQEIGNGSGGWGNNELEYYTNSPKNCFLSNGNLIIEARKEAIGGFNYSSTRMTTQNKKSFTYGRIDIRAKLPKGQGIWPAIWMLGSNISSLNWPACGEIDIMELLGHEPRKTYGTIHWGPAGGGSTHIGGNYSLTSGDFSTGFHVFSLKWEIDKLTILVDDIAYFTGTKAEVNGDYPFSKPFFFILNIAVGGAWPGNPDATTVFPQRMFVDYVRVFQ